MEKNKIIRLVVSLAISIALWVYVINVLNPSSTTTVRNIPVNLVGTEILEENNLAIVGDGVYTVDISVKAARSDLGLVSADMFQATADVSELTMGQDYITVSIKAPSGYTVEDIKSRKIQVYVDELYKKTVPVEINYEKAEENYEPTLLSVYPAKVDISGAKQLIENVEKYVVKLDTDSLKLEEAVDLKLSGDVKDSSGNNMNGLKVSTPEISISACIYSTKTVALNVRLEGNVWAGAIVNSSKIPSSVTIKGPADALTNISELQSKKINIDDACEDISAPIEINLPKGVYVADKDSNLTVNIDIADNGEISFNYSPKSIQTINLPEGLKVKYSVNTDKIVATVKGSVITLKTMSESDITLLVDGSGFSAGNKVVKLSVSSNISGISISLNPAEVNAEIK